MVAAGVYSEGVAHARLAARGARGAIVWAVTKLTGQICSAGALKRQLHLFIYSPPFGVHSACSRSAAHQCRVSLSAWRAGRITGWIPDTHTVESFFFSFWGGGGGGVIRGVGKQASFLFLCHSALQF